MSDLGLVSEVTSEVRGSFLAADLTIGDAEVVVEYGGDFDDEGGTFDLNGTRLTYSAVTDGDLPDDPDTLTLTDVSPIGADEGDTVSVVTGGQIAVDYWAVVQMDNAPAVMVPLKYDQLAGWPVGIYDPPVPVLVSEDLQHLEDAPGRTPIGRSLAWNRDEATAVADDTAVDIGLTWLPTADSMQVKQNGIDLALDEWAYDADTNTVTVAPSADLIIRTSDRFTAYYDRDEAADALVDSSEPPLDFVTEVNAAGTPVLWASLGDATGTTAQDETANNRDGTYGGTVHLAQPALAPGLPGSSTDFAGTGWVDYGTGASWQRPAHFSALIWVKPNSAAANMFLFGCDDAGTTDTDRIWHIYDETAGRVFSGATAYPSDTGEDIGLLAAGVATALLVTFDGSNVRLYKDGALVQTEPVSGAMNTSTLWPLTIAATANGQFGRLTYNGLAQHAILWDSALTADEADRIYRAGMGLP